MSALQWSIEGPHILNCNCDFGCPCQFVAPPTDGTCKAVSGYRIDKGHFGDTRLENLFAVNVYSWPGAIHQGGGEMQSIIDERADGAQRAALTAILQGEGADPGTGMLQIYRAMCDIWHEPVFAPIKMEIDVEARTGRIDIPGLIDTTIEPLKNPVTGADHRARIDLPMGKEFHLAEVASGTSISSGVIQLNFTNSHAHFSDAGMSSAGLIA